MRIATSMFKALLCLYPSSFRNEYGPEMTGVFSDRLRNSAGSFDAALISVEAFTGVLISAPREHFAMMMNDITYALRTLRHAKWFTATALVTLALGIGANTGIFSVIEAVLLRQLPFRDPDRIVMVWVKNPPQGFDHDFTSYPRLLDWRARSKTIAGFAAYTGTTHALTGSGDPEELRGVAASGNFFDVLGVRPAIGAAFSMGDDELGRPHKVVLSHAVWVRRFGGRTRS
jgi:hypothetical protein